MSKFIEAEVLIEKLQDEGADVTADYGYEYGAEFGYSLKKIKETIGGLPSADVEPVRHGEWLLVRRMAAAGEFKCSVCGRTETFSYFNKPENNPYCHCGAKMEIKLVDCVEEIL